ADPSGVRVPSKLTAGESPTARASSPMLNAISDLRMAHLADNSAMREDILHAGAAMRSRVPDHEHFAFPVVFIDGPAARFLPVKARRTGSFQARHPDNLNGGARRREAARKPVVPAGGGERPIN